MRTTKLSKSHSPAKQHSHHVVLRGFLVCKMNRQNRRFSPTNHMQGYMDSLCHSVDQGVYTDDPKQKAEIECIYSMVELYRANKIPTDNDIITIRKHFNADQLPNSGKCEFVNSLISLMMRRAGAYSTVKMGYVSIDKNVAKQTWSSMIYQNDTDYVAPHFWCQWGSNIIDATADQFGTFAPPIIRASKKQAKSGLFGIRYYSTNK